MAWDASSAAPEIPSSSGKSRPHPASPWSRRGRCRPLPADRTPASSLPSHRTAPKPARPSFGPCHGRPIRAPPTSCSMPSTPPTVPSYSRQTQGHGPIPGNSNIVPVVANGQVFVASNKQLAIFGPITAGAAVATLASASSAQIPALGNQLSGWVDRINGTELMIKKRNGDHARIDAKPAQDAFQSVPIGMEEAITAEGNYDAQGVLHAQTIVRAKDFRALWPPDR